jgi:hypothetical protein
VERSHGEFRHVVTKWNGVGVHSKENVWEIKIAEKRYHILFVLQKSLSAGEEKLQ